jgi:hypothetical protein
MGVALGIKTILGTSAAETVYGTPVVVDAWHEFLSESLSYRENRIMSEGIGGGTSRKLRRGAAEVVSTYDAGGSLEMEIPVAGFGRWLKHMVDGSPTTAQQGATPAYLHTFALGDALPPGFTLQKGLYDAAGTEIEKFTYHGGKVLSWEIALASGAIAKASLELDFEDVDTTTALAAASYGNPAVYNFAQGVIELDDGAVGTVTSISIRGRNNLKTDSYYIGAAGLKGEPADDDFPEVDGTLTYEFDDPTIFHDRLMANTAAKLELNMTGAQIDPAPWDEELFITIPEVRLTGGTPNVDGRGVVTGSVPFHAREDGTNPGLTIAYQSIDTTVT